MVYFSSDWPTLRQFVLAESFLHYSDRVISAAMAYECFIFHENCITDFIHVVLYGDTHREKQHAYVCITSER